MQLLAKFKQMLYMGFRATLNLRKFSQNFDFSACPSHNVVKRDASGKKGKLLCCKRIFNRIKANLAKIQP